MQPGQLHGQVYLVGGAVRDHLLGWPIKDRDWVVVGQTPESMLAAGFKQVGRDFPVFLHPETHEEYALARTERKAGTGYHGFEIYASPEVTLEQDLSRRDLTINAMAMDDAGSIIDPYGGRRDVEGCVLRHVSPAFMEDPLRLVRCARFYATLPGFTLHPETRSMLIEMARSGELEHLSAERVWVETQKALRGDMFRFFQAIDQMQAWSWWRELEGKIDGIDQPMGQEASVTIRWATLGALLTPQASERLCQRLRCDQLSAWLMQSVARECTFGQDKHTAREWWDRLKRLDAIRRPDRAKSWGRAWAMVHHQNPDALLALMDAMITAVRAVALDAQALEQLQGPERGQWLEAKRLDAVESVLKRHPGDLSETQRSSRD